MTEIFIHKEVSDTELALDDIANKLQVILLQYLCPNQISEWFEMFELHNYDVNMIFILKFSTSYNGFYFSDLFDIADLLMEYQLKNEENNWFINKCY